MITTTLALDLVANVLSALIYRIVAKMLAARPVEGKARLAAWSFAAWWYVLALLALYGAFADVMSMLEAWTLPMLVTALNVLLLVILLALGGLVYYLLYLYTGREGTWKPVLAFYGLFWAYLVYHLQALGPKGIKAGAITPQLDYVRDPATHPFAPILAILLILPILAAAIAYFTLFFRTKEPTQRYRIAVVAASIVLWFSFSLVGSLAGVSQSLQWVVLSRAVSLAAAAGVYLAYRPPAWVQRRWHVDTVGRGT
ncbi:MAG TPA: hypothetical protein VM286_04470 [Candidatus Thermoplasmatota archaeon]|nr:hypothetical protein [Candidatus Thermoplasmatota archaeon]